MHRIAATIEIVALTVQEELLIKTVRSLPAVEAQRILNWAKQLASLAKERPIEWSDTWTPEDLSDATAASILHFEEPQCPAD